MHWLAIEFIVLTVLKDVNFMEAKLAAEHPSSSSSEAYMQILTSNNNNNYIFNNDINDDKLYNMEALLTEAAASKANIKVKQSEYAEVEQHENNIDKHNWNFKVSESLESVYDDGDVGFVYDKADDDKIVRDVKRITEIRYKIPTITDKAKTKIKTTATSSVSNRIDSITTTTTAAAQPSRRAQTKLQQYSYGFLNPFGQLVAFFGSDQLQHLQDYTLLFNAERQTVFQLHTNIQAQMPPSSSSSPTAAAVKRKRQTPTTTTTMATENSNVNGNGRVLNIVSDSIGAVFGVNTAATMTATSNSIGDSGAATATTNMPRTRVEEVQLYNAASLRKSHYNPFNPTRILIHGWFGGSHANVYTTLIPEYLKLGSGNYNVIAVDWGRGAIADYITASYRVKPVGKVVAKFIDFLHKEAGMRFEDLHVIGFSMGAHVAGIAGKYVQSGRLPVIYALDPALPFFRYENIAERVAITDADYVEVIHTSVGSYGYDRPLGHVDFYVNYGSNQPGCFFNECSHFRAFQVFAEALRKRGTMRGLGCDVQLWPDLVRNRRCLMGTGLNMSMGGDPINVTALRGRGGVYYLTTNTNAPFAGAI